MINIWIKRRFDLNIRRGIIRNMEKQALIKPLRMQYAEPEFMCECGCKFYVYENEPEQCEYCNEKFDWE